MSTKFYAIKNGRKSNVVVNAWDECNKLVNGYKGAVFKSFKNETDAWSYLGCIKKDNIITDKDINLSIKSVVTCYTDGACSGNGKINGGAGGWGAVIIENGKRTEISGGSANTTNNRMELQGCIEALKFVKTPSEITLISDSKYVIDGINKGWAINWRKNNWLKYDGQPVKNPELWHELLDLIAFHKSVKFQWVKGHASNPENNRCDKLAVAESRKYR